MADKQEAAGVRRKVVDSAKEKLKSERADLPEHFVEEVGHLLGAASVPKADAFLALFQKQVGSNS